ncbi:hypothetical protein BOO30_08310 [Vibrio navarrensis]|uniref:DUF2982 domain-containing protein n=1 Tax=Vibrio navarrensis TaxID=29495 RepID=UPI001866C32B|nr:DUF2982 domain-containing protein [Vibrio navarrensis]MBE3663989.1 hypothetical protein [Vibrio navarrensis]MBE4574305.1 hypothetical protein [Vibrio navarrensis]MBE4577493.1 hypothetical protein [Vibrio navarrensis]MBE4596403.1 hypothetical protein [Vibrio navarrensis]
MQTLQLCNYDFSLNSAKGRGFIGGFLAAALLLLSLSTSWLQAFVAITLLLFLALLGIYLMLRSQVKYTLTATHFQQHLFKGGWVVKWRNIEKIGVCTVETQGWHQPLPWIGIKLKDYTPYLDAICPRVASEILLSQRALLYLGAHQHQCTSQFEDMVLNSDPVHIGDERLYTGLKAMLANRMRYQRRFFDYDIFISAQDLDREADDFVGLVRRYLAAAEPD